MPQYNLKDKVVIITGASSGIGAACAEAFAAEGAKITITGRNESRLKEVAKKCQNIGLSASDILTLVVDHAKEVQNMKVVSETASKFGRIDVLVNNAGFGGMHTTENSTKEDYEMIFNVNTRAPFRLTQLAIPYLRKAKGSVVNISSIAGIKGFKESVPYCMSKAALDNFTRASALELGPDGIRVNCINPGYIYTNFIRRIDLPDAIVSQAEKEQEKRHPLGRNGQPQEVADAVLFLASDEASFVTGVTIPVDGGRIAQLP